MEKLKYMITESAFTTVANAYSDWKHNALTFEEFEERMQSAYFAYWDMIQTLEYHGAIDEATMVELERYVFNLTRTY